MADDLGSLFTGRRLNYRQIETVIGILLEAASGFGKAIKSPGLLAGAACCW